MSIANKFAAGVACVAAFGAIGFIKGAVKTAAVVGTKVALVEGYRAVEQEQCIRVMRAINHSTIDNHLAEGDPVRAQAHAFIDEEAGKPWDKLSAMVETGRLDATTYIVMVRENNGSIMASIECQPFKAQIEKINAEFEAALAAAGRS